MRVIPVASTFFIESAAEEFGYKRHEVVDAWDELPTMPDELAEFAGRMCYQSWERPNPATATNEGYVANILRQQHESVLEHASVSFGVDGVSRSLLTELTRHRHLSFSVVSQRYVDMKDARFLVPPGMKRLAEEQWLTLHQDDVPNSDDEYEQEFEELLLPDIREFYDTIANTMMEHGVKRKQAREAARSILPNCVEVKMVVTGNIRAWRDVLKKRYHVAADEEIRIFAEKVLENLREIAPASVQDIPDEPYGTP